VKDTGPILGLISKLFEFLAPILGALAKAIGAILKVFEPVIKIIWEVVKYIVVAIGGVLGAVIQVINWVEQFIGWLIELFGDKKKAAEMRANMTDMDAYWQSLKDLAGSTWDQQAAADAATTSSWDAAIANKELAATTASVTEQLLNVPSGYKIAYARYAAMFAYGEGPGSIDRPPGMGPGISTGPASDRIGQGGVPQPGSSINVNGDVNIDVSGNLDADAFAKKINQSNRVRNAQATGSWYQKRGG
jgi:hypothetical protein